MKIRTRMTLWYAIVSLAAVALMGALSFHEFDRDERARAVRSDHDGRRDHGDDAWYERLVGISVRAGLPTLAVALAGGWWLMRRSLAPLEALTTAVEQKSERNLHEQIPRTGNGDEIDRLTDVFNATSTRLDQSFQRIRDFTLHASHELKTPLTVMQGELEAACRLDDLSDEQRDRILSQLDEVQRLAKIVDGLSLLTKADAGQVALKQDPVRLDDLVREAVEDGQHLGEASRIQVGLDGCEPVTVLGDRHRLRQLLLNLVDNAIKYNDPGGRVTLALRARGHQAELVVSNTGPGLSRELLPRVFERFFRGDASHNSAVDGSGLGLAIVQWIAGAHGGSVQFDSDAGALTTVTVLLPASSAAHA